MLNSAVDRAVLVNCTGAWCTALPTEYKDLPQQSHAFPRCSIARIYEHPNSWQTRVASAAGQYDPAPAYGRVTTAAAGTTSGTFSVYLRC